MEGGIRFTRDVCTGARPVTTGTGRIVSRVTVMN